MLQETISEHPINTLDNESELDESPKIVYENIQVKNNNGNDKHVRRQVALHKFKDRVFCG